MPVLENYPGRRRDAPSSMRPIRPGVAVTRDGRQTLNRTWWPVVLVPGIMGSRVEREDGTDSIWDPDRTGFMLSLMSQSPDTLTRLYNHRLTPGRTIRTIASEDNSSLENPSDSHERAIGRSRNDRNWGSISWEYYGPGAVGIQRDIAVEGGVLWCFGYDWRRSNLDNGRLLRAFIANTVRPTSPYKPIIVTHSMGGLVTRAACRVHGMESMVSGVIHTMMPTYGAAEAYGSIKHGRMAFPFRYLFGNTHMEIACVASGVTGYFQLMPAQNYPRADWLSVDSKLDPHCDPKGPFPLADAYAIYRESNGMVGLVRHETFNGNVVNVGGNRYVRRTRRVLQHMLDNIAEAERYHSQLVRDYCAPRTWLIAETGRTTVVTVQLAFRQDSYKGIALRPEAIGNLASSTEGDATVPLVSARALEEHPNCRGGFIVSGDFDHADSTNQPIVIDAIGDLIRRIRREGLLRW
jgi:pimeloyl-ACP methyl ester carboxylesterase